MPCLVVGVLSGLLSVMSAFALGAGLLIAVASYLIFGSAATLVFAAFLLSLHRDPAVGDEPDGQALHPATPG